MDEGLAARISQMLERVVVDGTGTSAAVPGYRVAGKTGTAQRMFEGTFDDVHHVAWFAGFLPADEPRVVIVVSVVEPSEDFWASNVAAPVFARIGAMVATVLEIPADPELVGPGSGADSPPAELPPARVAHLGAQAATADGGAA
jgi:cell division protein FtsI (penicillin-binding protein 3)